MDDGDGCERSQNRKSNFVPSFGNFSIQYNIASASIAVQILGSGSRYGHAIYPEPRWSSQVSLASVFAGAMLGMLLMGRLGDVLGRQRAMRVTQCLCMLGCLITALMFGPPDTAYGILCLGRFIVGFGVGGIYPLSAVASAEGSTSATSRGTRVGWALFWQSFGAIAPYLLAILFFTCMQSEPPSAEWVPQFQFRFLLALGFLQAAVLFVASMREEESAAFRATRTEDRAAVGIVTALKRERPQTRWTLVGTTGTWFLYDVVCYGTTVFTPAIINDICLSGTKVGGVCHQSLREMSVEACVAGAIGIPGCYLSILLGKRLGSNRLNIYGFLLLALNFAAFALVYMIDALQVNVLYFLYCSLNFLLLGGPCVGTYVIPAICFPAHIRSTCHGISAFGGKLGALVGTLAFPIITASLGLPALLLTQAVLSLLGAFVSHAFLKNDWEYLSTDDRTATLSFVEGRSFTSAPMVQRC